MSDHLRAPERACRIIEKRYTGLLLHLAEELDHIAHISCRYCPDLCTFLNLGAWMQYLPAYRIEKQTDTNSNCRATSKVAFCTSPATSGAGWGGHPNFEMLYLAHFLTVSHAQSTVRKLSIGAFSLRKNKEFKISFNWSIIEIHKCPSWLTNFNPAIQQVTQSQPKLGIVLLHSCKVWSQGWSTENLSGWSKRANIAPLCNTHTDSNLQGENQDHSVNTVVVWAHQILP